MVGLSQLGWMEPEAARVNSCKQRLDEVAGRFSGAGDDCLGVSHLTGGSSVILEDLRKTEMSC